ncbi:helix-turn-helix domain-containing protein [Streptomyces sp. LRE541]|uniref:helix-turn-helix domain-containing protein n=1 Tax=Streptomyces sp. LRE541 TaxID=2931983 RepID=UPI00200F33F6|nr:helix-turn-helix domain-containing protein [Streptomyces sp. LRE541]UPZ27706.1 helix-turn-helix domain-containing protein [Streptomyces sp. LRE541]
MSAWHKARWQWQTTDEEEVAVVVEDRLPDWGLTRLGRRIAARQLAERSASVEEVADLIGVDPRTVYRWRAEDRTTAATGPTPPPDVCTCAKCGGNPASRAIHRTKGEAA